MRSGAGVLAKAASLLFSSQIAGRSRRIIAIARAEARRRSRRHHFSTIEPCFAVPFPEEACLSKD